MVGISDLFVDLGEVVVFNQVDEGFTEFEAFDSGVPLGIGCVEFAYQDACGLKNVVCHVSFDSLFVATVGSLQERLNLFVVDV